MKKKLLFGLTPIILAAPFSAISCKQKPELSKPKDDSNFENYLTAFNKLELKDLNLYNDKNILNKDIKNLEAYSPTDFYKKYLYNQDLDIMLKLVTIDKESQYYSLIGNDPTSDFSKKYEVVIYGRNSLDNLTIPLELALMPKNSTYKYKNQDFKYYFYYARKYINISGFKDEAIKIAKAEKQKRTNTIISIAVPLAALLALILYISIKIRINKKRGIKRV